VRNVIYFILKGNLLFLGSGVWGMGYGVWGMGYGAWGLG